MKNCNKLIALVLVVTSLFVLFCGGLNVSAEVAETFKTTTDPYFADATTCTCEVHSNLLTTTVVETEPGFSLGEDTMNKVSDLGEEAKGIVGLLHKFFAKFNAILDAILNFAGNFSNLLG